MRIAVRVLLLGVLVGIGVTPCGVAAATPTPTDVTVSIDQPALRTTIGHRFQVISTVRNDSDRPLSGLVAHLDVLSVDPGVYVDPEDWSSQRTVYLDQLGAHESVPVPWKMQVVNDGRFVVFVSVTRRNGVARVAASDGLRLSATAQRSVNVGGVLPLVLGIPCVVLALMLLAGAQRRRLRVVKDSERVRRPS